MKKKKPHLLEDHLPSWSQWTEPSQHRLLLLLAPCPQAPWEMKPHSCFRTSAPWCLYSEESSLSQVWDWEQSLVLVPAPTLLINDCHFQLEPRRESCMPGGTLLSRVLSLHPHHLQSIQHALLLVTRHWLAVFPPEHVPTGATHKTNAMSLC